MNKYFIGEKLAWELEYRGFIFDTRWAYVEGEVVEIEPWEVIELEMGLGHKIIFTGSACSKCHLCGKENCTNIHTVRAYLYHQILFQFAEKLFGNVSFSDVVIDIVNMLIAGCKQDDIDEMIKKHLVDSDCR